MLHGVIEKGKKAAQHPEQVIPFLKNQFYRSLAYVSLMYQKHQLDHQRDKIDELRREDDLLLIVLDACRYDFFQNQHEDYLITEAEPVLSAGMNTFEYGRYIWGDDVYDVTYVSAATPIHSEPMDMSNDDVSASGLIRQGQTLREYYQGFVPTEHISDIVDVWKSGWDDELGVTPPEVVTDQAIKEAKSSNQLVAHYFQPHAPYIGNEQELGNVRREDVDNPKGVVIDSTIYERISNGEITDSRLKELYRSNLDRVLPEVARLITNTEFERVVVMGDHGEALGEYRQYMHGNRENPYVRIVPWAEIQGVKEGNIDQRNTVDLDRREKEANVRDRLQQLGYID